MRTIHKSILSGGAMILIMAAFAIPGLAQSLNSRSSDLSIQNTTPKFVVAPSRETLHFSRIAPESSTASADWNSLSDEAKKAFGDQLSKDAPRWSAENGETSSSVRKENGGLFVSRGPQPLQSRVQN